MLSEHRVSKLTRKLDLDDRQRDALFAAADTARPALRKLRQQLHDSRQAMPALDAKSPRYDAEIAKLAKQHGDLVGHMTLAFAGIKSTLAEVLTSEQLEKLAKLRQHPRGHHRKHKHDEDDNG